VNLTKIWTTALGNMQVQTSRHEYTTWLRQTALLSIDNGTATVGVTSAFVKEGIENRFSRMLRDVVTDVVGYPVGIRVVIAPHALRTEARPAQIEEPVEPAPVAVSSNRNGYQTASSASNGLYTNGHYPNAKATSNGHAQNGNGALYQHGQGGNGQGELPNNYSYSPPLRERDLHQLDLTTAMRSRMLNPSYTFDRFIVGSSNRMASAACMAVAENPAQSYNPLFLYGGVGLGKTHLLHAIGNYALDRDPEISVMYVSSEQFTNELINAIRRQQTEEFRIRYRNIDILLIDDIQFIAGKESTQEEFFHTFNTLHAAGKRIVISSDRPPKAIATLEDRLRSRFEWGLICDVQMPDLETRTAILRAKAETMDTLIPADVIDFLAHRIPSNIRELEGCLNRVVAYARLQAIDVSPEVAAAALNELLDTSRKRKVSTDIIIREVSSYYSVDVRAMQGRSRSRNIVVPRQVAMYLIREETATSLVEIGGLLGGRDHTTVMYGCEKIGEEIDRNATLRQEIANIRDRIYERAARD
jgi:chromosomal replication initiator protein